MMNVKKAAQKLGRHMAGEFTIMPLCRPGIAFQPKVPEKLTAQKKVK